MEKINLHIKELIESKSEESLQGNESRVSTKQQFQSSFKQLMNDEKGGF